MGSQKNNDIVVDKSQADIGNTLACGDYNRSGSKLIVAGSDRKLYVYDDNLMRLETALSGRNLKIVGHQNRIFGVKCHPESPNLFASAGWDGSVKLYDIRSSTLICSMSGPQISGDSIDIHGDMIVTGSNRGSDVMQLFSISQQRRIFTFDYSPKSITKVNEGYSLATKFTSDGNFIITGGAGLREIKMFANDSDSAA